MESKLTVKRWEDIVKYVYVHAVGTNYSLLTSLVLINE